MLVNEKRAAEMLCTTSATLRVHRCMGQRPNGAPVCPYLKIGRKIAYDTLDIERYLDAFRVNPQSGGAA